MKPDRVDDEEDLSGFGLAEGSHQIAPLRTFTVAEPIPFTKEYISGVFLKGDIHWGPDELTPSRSSYPPRGTYYGSEMGTYSSVPPSSLGVEIRISTVPPEIPPSEEKGKTDKLLQQIAMAIHNLRNKLCVITTTGEVILEEIAEKKPDLFELIKQELEEIQEATQSAINATTQINTLIAERENRLKIHKRQIDLPHFMRKLASTYHNRRNINVSCSAKTGSIDPTHLENVLGNLIGNALKYASDSNIEVNCSSNANGDLVFEVIDNGPGLGENPEKLFGIYSRGANQKEEKTGFGLGLHYCKIITDEHDGTITAENNPQGGAIFRITIPQPPTSAQK